MLEKMSLDGYHFKLELLEENSPKDYKFELENFLWAFTQMLEEKLLK